MDVRDVTRVSSTVGMSFLGEIQQLVFDMRWFIALAIVLIVVDFKFGKEKSQIENIPFRKSRAVRQTVNKFIDYMCWLFFAAVMGKAFGSPYGVDVIFIAAVVMTVVCLIELDSIIDNYLVAKGYHAISLRTFIIALVKRKNKDIGEALDETLKDKEEKK